jgi:hypothetical protein
MNGGTYIYIYILDAASGSVLLMAPGRLFKEGVGSEII